MKGSNQIAIQSNPVRPSELRYKAKQNQSDIASISMQILKKRQTMKKMSQEMTKLIEKKLIRKEESVYSHPNFHPQFADPQIQNLHNQRQSIYAQIYKLKCQVAVHLVNEEPEVVNQIKRKESTMQNMDRQISKLKKQKEMEEKQLNQNKQTLLYYQESQIIRQIQQKQKEMQTVRKQIRQIDKSINKMQDQEIAINLYMDEIEKQIQMMDIQEEDEQQVDKKLFDQVVQEIKSLTQQRKLADRQYTAKKQQLIIKIKQLREKNIRIERNIRQISNSQLQRQLQIKKRQLAKNKSTPQIGLKQKQSPLKSKLKGLKDGQLPSLLLTQPIIRQKKIKNQRKSPKSNSRTIIIGNWKEQNHIRDDIIETRNISRAVSMKIRTKDKKIIGIGVTYIDNIGVQVLGRSNIWRIGDDKQFENGQQEFIIDLEDVIAIYHYSQTVTSQQNNSSTAIGLKFMSKSSKPMFKIGEFLNQEEIQLINLQNQVIKTVQFTLDTNYKSISGIKLVLIPINTPKIEKQQSQIGQQIDKIQMLDQKNEGLMPSKWMSTTSQAGLTQKKVFIKKSSIHTRRLSQIPQVDHRLLLNRKKKMV